MFEQLEELVQAHADETNLPIQEWKATYPEQYQALIEEVFPLIPAYRSQFRSFRDDGSYGETSDMKDIAPKILHESDGVIVHSPTPNPVFTYGTLRLGQSNYRHFLEGNYSKVEENGVLEDAAMYRTGFPYVIQDVNQFAGDEVKGDLFWLDEESFANIMIGLDMLEGTHHPLVHPNNHYDRVLRYIRVGENEYVQAWVYLVRGLKAQSVQSSLPRISNGDWKNPA